MRRILFQGTSDTKIIDHYDHPEVQAEVTPLIVIQNGKDAWGNNELRWGMILQCAPQKMIKESENITSLEPFEIEETFSTWSNPIIWWRALQLIEGMPTLHFRLFGLSLWIAAGRADPDDCFDQEIIEEIRSALGEGHDYQEIMARPVPMEIIQLTIRLIDEGLDMHGVQYDLTDEIEVGTVRWSQELKRVGVSHPDYRKATQTARAVVIERYKDHLVSYAAFRNIPYSPNSDDTCLLTLCIEWAIYEAIERGIEQDYGIDITIMISILHEEIQSDAIHEALVKKHPFKRNKPYVRPTPEERFAQVIAWYTEHFKGTARTKEDLLAELHRLYERWDQIPIVNPLVN